MSSPLDAEQFADALNSERGLSPPIFTEGYVRKTADKDIIEFSPSAAMCLAWIKIPLKMIDKAQPLGKRPCIDHLHDYVILYFKRPDSSEAVVFAELLHHEANARVSSAAMTAAWNRLSGLSPDPELASLAFCDFSCRALTGPYYDQTLLGLRLAKTAGIIRDRKRCYELADNASKLAEELYKVLGPAAEVIARLVTRDCVRCACEKVFD